MQLRGVWQIWDPAWQAWNHRRKLQKSGVSVFIQSNLQFTTLNLDKYSVDRDIEVCALQLDSTFLNICILAICRSPAGNFNTFVYQLDKIQKIVYYKIKPYNMWWCKCKLSTGKWQRDPVECPFKFIQSF